LFETYKNKTPCGQPSLAVHISKLLWLFVEPGNPAKKDAAGGD
jgi:hypothetical protein